MKTQRASQTIAMNEDGARKRRKTGVAEEWTASLYKTTSSPPDQLLSGPTNKSELEKFIKTLFPTDEIIMEPESKRVGNSGGFNLIELLGRMTKIEKQFDEDRQKQPGKIEEQQQKLEETDYSLLMAHAYELESTAGLDDRETRHERNEIIHGGDIKISSRTIAFLRRRNEIRRAENASVGFRMTYGFSIHELGPLIATAPEEIVELFNLRGTLRKLDVWRNRFPTKSQTWIGECDQIIRDWLRAGGGSASHIRNRAKEEYMKVSQQMADCLQMSRDTRLD